MKRNSFRRSDENLFIHILGLENSASKEIYIKTNQFIEKLSDIIYIAIGEVTPLIWVAPKCCGCLFFYFATDLGSEAFELPLPTW